MNFAFSWAPDRDWETCYAVFGESGTASAGEFQTITLDGNQSTIVAVGHNIDIYGGTGRGQIRRIVEINTNVITVDRAWETIPDSTSLYNIYGGWGESVFDDVTGYAQITMVISINSALGERAICQNWISAKNDGTGITKYVDYGS